jgi:hypothetical protein
MLDIVGFPLVGNHQYRYLGHGDAWFNGIYIHFLELKETGHDERSRRLIKMASKSSLAQLGTG